MKVNARRRHAYVRLAVSVFGVQLSNNPESQTRNLPESLPEVSGPNVALSFQGGTCEAFNLLRPPAIVRSLPEVP